MNQTEIYIPEETRRVLNVQSAQETSTLWAELQRQQRAKRDFIVPASQLKAHHVVRRVDPSDTSGDYVVQSMPALEFPLALEGLSSKHRISFMLNRIAHEQLNDRTTGQHYGRKLLSSSKHAEQWEKDQNYWLQQLGDQKLLLRTLDDKLRAILSNGFFIIDHFDTAMEIVGTVLNTPGAVVQSMQLTEEKIYIRIVRADHALQLERQADGVRALRDEHPGQVHREADTITQKFQDLATGDWIAPAVTISNSEVGRGGLTMQAGWYQTWCLNLATTEKAFGKIHRGGELDDMLTDDTRKKQRAAIFGELRDVITNVFDLDNFREKIRAYLGMQETQIEVSGAKELAIVMKRVDSSFTEDEAQQILNRLIMQGEGSNAFALVNAVTLFAHQQPDQDRRAELEAVGGRMIESFPRELVAVRR